MDRHPDPDVDVVILLVSEPLNWMADEGHRPFFRTIGTDQFASQDEISDCDAVEEITFVGYPNGIYDEVNLLPVVRRGITATPVGVDYSGSPVFLIDASVFPGSSGSPVVLMTSGRTYRSRGGGVIVGSRFFLLGLVASVFF